MRILLPVIIMFLFLMTSCSPRITGIERFRNYENKLRHQNEVKLTVENFNGIVKIEAREGIEDATVSAVLKATGKSESAAEEFLDKIDVRFTRVGDEFSAKTIVPKTWTMASNRGKKPMSFSVEYKIIIPEGLDIETAISNGSVEIAGKNADVVGQSVNGDVTIRDNTGSVNAVTVNGSTYVSNSQDYEIKLRQTTQNGSHTLDLPNAQYGIYKLRTTSGDIDIKMPSSVEPDIEVNVANGSIKLEMGKRLAGKIDLITTNGTVSSDMVVNTTTSIGGSKTPTELIGRIGAGPGKVKAETKNGDIVMNYGSLE